MLFVHYIKNTLERTISTNSVCPWDAFYMSHVNGIHYLDFSYVSSTGGIPSLYLHPLTAKSIQGEKKQKLQQSQTP